ncbi:hypothetical protein ACFZC3_22985 [Streptomyces sp. NPDC007903]|uniref:hypothetical protein n=1 Tax=Streptomyces sp. NPDC007903 TaxID=3364786 RepID=UPI0036E78E30
MTGTLEGVDPRATYAILVGIEKYENDAYLFPLPDSPAVDALAHAAWLRASGVPADQIRLCLSVADARRESVEAEAAALGIEVRGATQADIWTVLDTELPTWKGDLLWLAWSGHGVLDPGTGEQYLFFADAIRFREYTLSTENLQNTLLHNPRYAGIPRTVLLVDACRQYRPDFTGAGGFRFSAPTQHSAGSALMSLYATQDGATASNGRSGRGGAFTCALLAELTAAPAWPPDPQTLIEPVRARLTADRTRQTPHLDARHWNGDRRDWGRTTPRHASVLTHDQACTASAAKAATSATTASPTSPRRTPGTPPPPPISSTGSPTRPPPSSATPYAASCSPRPGAPARPAPAWRPPNSRGNTAGTSCTSPSPEAAPVPAGSSSTTSWTRYARTPRRTPNAASSSSSTTSTASPTSTCAPSPTPSAPRTPTAAASPASPPYAPAPSTSSTSAAPRNSSRRSGSPTTTPTNAPSPPVSSNASPPAP